MKLLDFIRQADGLFAELMDAKARARKETNGPARKAILDDARERLSVRRRELALALPVWARLFVGVRSLLEVTQSSLGVVQYHGRRQVFDWGSVEDLDLVEQGLAGIWAALPQIEALLDQLQAATGRGEGITLTPGQAMELLNVLAWGIAPQPKNKTENVT